MKGTDRIEELERERGDVPSVCRVRAQALSELKNAAAPEVGDTIGGGHLVGMLGDEVEKDAFPQRPIAGAKLVQSETFDQRFRQQRAGGDQVDASPVEADELGSPVGVV